MSANGLKVVCILREIHNIRLSREKGRIEGTTTMQKKPQNKKGHIRAHLKELGVLHIFQLQFATHWGSQKLLISLMISLKRIVLLLDLTLEF